MAPRSKVARSMVMPGNAIGCCATAGADASSKTMSPPAGWENSFGNERMTPLQTRGAGVAAVGYASKIAASSFEHRCLHRCHWLTAGWLRLPRRRHRHDPQLEHRAVATAVIRSPARPVPVMGDSCRQVSWLAAQSASLPPSRRLARQWHSGATLAAYSCGGSRGFEVSDLAPRSLFTAAVRPGPQRDRHAPPIEATP